MQAGSGGSISPNGAPIRRGYAAPQRRSWDSLLSGPAAKVGQQGSKGAPSDAAVALAKTVLLAAGQLGGELRRKRRRRVQFKPAAEEVDEPVEDMERIEAEAFAMDTAAAGASGAAEASVTAAAAATTSSAAARAAQAGYTARHAVTSKFLKGPQNINKKEGCELLNCVAAVLDARHILRLECRWANLA
jgi:hypothetical protein